MSRHHRAPLRHYALSTARAGAAFLPPAQRAVAARALGGLGPAPHRLTDAGIEEVAAAAIGARRPRPVVLLHGTDDTSGAFTDLASALRGAGHAVAAPDYGREAASIRGRSSGGGATGDLAASAAEVARFVDRVRAVSGAGRVDLVGHSQGGLHAHAYARAVGATGVGHVVTLGTALTGTSLLGPADALAGYAPIGRLVDAWLGPSARAQIRGSAALSALGLDRELPAGVRFTSIATRYDQTVRPPHAQRLPEGPGVRNAWVQDAAPQARTSHADLPRDPAAIALVVQALAEGEQE